MGWELFLNYLIAKEKFKPDLFLYENNVSADPSIKEEIKKDLGVDDFALLRGEESPASYVEINSALVSAQSRKRFYVHNCGADMPMPKDRGILLKDILETGGNMSMDRWYGLKNVREGEGKAGLNPALLNPSEEDDGKSRTIKASYSKSSFANFLRDKGFDATGVAERIPSAKDNPNKQAFDYVAEEIPEWAGTKVKTNETGLRLAYDGKYKGGTPQGSIVRYPGGKADTVTASQPGKVFDPICVNPQSGDFGGSFASKGGQPSVQNRVYSDEGKSTALTTAFNPKIAEPCCLRMERDEVAKTFRKQYEKGEVKFGFNEHKTLQPRPDGKTNTPTTVLKDNTLAGETKIEPGEVVDLANENSKTRRGRKCAGKCHALLTDNTYYQYLGTKDRPVYEVRGGK